ncbi:MAG TPA: hypothetical protein DEG44_01275, partial [Candidatus Kerfeldbacteria bacterium]|nr:hypothetical protein [Candidatus Kerfeldbacteria bacterium]
MKWWHIVLYALGFGVTIVAEVASWSIPSLAFTVLPSVVYCGVLANSVSWPKSAVLAVLLGGLIDVFAPAPFGTWMIALVLLVIVTE